MKLPPGLGITDSIVNLEETFGKVVGRHKPMPPQERYAQLLRLGRGLSTGGTGLPKGVHRFRNHEEANLTLEPLPTGNATVGETWPDWVPLPLRRLLRWLFAPRSR